MRRRFKGFVMFGLLILLGLYTLSFGFFAYYRFPLLIPREATLLFVKRMIGDRLFLQCLLTSIALGTVVGCMSTVIGFMTAMPISRMKKHRLGLTFLYSLPLFIPNMALFIGCHMMMIRLGLNNRFIGVVLGHMLIGLPYAINIAVGYFDGIDSMYGEVSRTLGANRLQTFIKVWIPLIRPGLLMSFSLGFLLSFSEYFSTFLLGGGRVMSFTMLYYPALNNADMGKSSLFSGIFVIIHLGLFAGVTRYQNKKGRVKQVLYNFG